MEYIVHEQRSMFILLWSRTHVPLLDLLYTYAFLKTQVTLESNWGTTAHDELGKLRNEVIVTYLMPYLQLWIVITTGSTAMSGLWPPSGFLINFRQTVRLPGREISSS
jgi:hypothetical protein